MCLVMFTISGCADFFRVENQNAPGKDEVFANPEDVMNSVGGSFYSLFTVLEKSYPGMGLSAAGDELSSSWGGWGMWHLSWEPRTAWDNSPAYPYNNFTETPWYFSYHAISAVNDGLNAITDGVEFGENGQHTGMVEAFARFVQGLAHGWLALFFDKAFILGENTDLEVDEIDFAHYTEVMDFALLKLEECLAICEKNTFSTPQSWINGRTLSNEQLARLCYSYIARFMAWVARSQEVRQGLDWPLIMAHAEAGIKEDFTVMGDDGAWWSRLKGYSQHPTWCRADCNAIGPADTSSNYSNWLATPVYQRMHFLIHTADRRITGDDPMTDGTDFSYDGDPVHREHRGTYHFSAYTHQRYLDYFENGHIGDLVMFKTTELDLLIAEGLLHTGGDPGRIADLINRTRVHRGQMSPATAQDALGSINDAHDPSPGASLWSKLKHEKFIENFCVTAGTGYFERRGWGELIPGTPLHWPVPGRELQVLIEEIYTHGGDTGDVASKVIFPHDPLWVSSLLMN